MNIKEKPPRSLVRSFIHSFIRVVHLFKKERKKGLKCKLFFSREREEEKSRKYIYISLTKKKPCLPYVSRPPVFPPTTRRRPISPICMYVCMYLLLPERIFFFPTHAAIYLSCIHSFDDLMSFLSFWIPGQAKQSKTSGGWGFEFNSFF